MWFWFVFFDDYDVGQPCISHFYLFFQEISNQILCPLKNGLFVFLLFLRILYIFLIQVLTDIWFANIFSFLCGVCFHFLDGVFWSKKFYLFFYLFIFFGCTCGIWKFLGQGSNLCHSSDQSCCSDNTRSLTCCAIRELPKSFKFWCNPIYLFFLWLFMFLSHLGNLCLFQGNADLHLCFLLRIL